MKFNILTIIISLVISFAIINANPPNTYERDAIEWFAKSNLESHKMVKEWKKDHATLPKFTFTPGITFTESVQSKFNQFIESAWIEVISEHLSIFKNIDDILKLSVNESEIIFPALLVTKEMEEGSTISTRILHLLLLIKVENDSKPLFLELYKSRTLMKIKEKKKHVYVEYCKQLLRYEIEKLDEDYKIYIKSLFKGYLKEHKSQLINKKRFKKDFYQQPENMSLVDEEKKLMLDNEDFLAECIKRQSNDDKNEQNHRNMFSLFYKYYREFRISQRKNNFRPQELNRKEEEKKLKVRNKALVGVERDMKQILIDNQEQVDLDSERERKPLKKELETLYEKINASSTKTYI